MSMVGCVVHRSKLCGMRQLWGELRGSNTGRTCVLVSVGPVRAMYYVSCGRVFLPSHCLYQVVVVT